MPGEAGQVSQSGRTTYPDGFLSPPRARAAIVRTGWPETAVGPPAAPHSAARLHRGSRGGGGGGALLGARRQPAGGPTGMPVASRSVDGRSFPAALRTVRPLGPPSAGRGGRGRRGAPPGAPRPRSTAPRGAAGPPGGIFTFRRRSLAVAARADFVHFVFGLFAAFVSTIYMRKRKVIILVF